MVKNYDIEKDETNVSDDPKENVKALSSSLDKVQLILKDIALKTNLIDKEGKLTETGVSGVESDLTSTKSDLSDTQDDLTTTQEGLVTAQEDVVTAQDDADAAQADADTAQAKADDNEDDITALQGEDGLKTIYWQTKNGDCQDIGETTGPENAVTIADITFTDLATGAYRVSWHIEFEHWPNFSSYGIYWQNYIYVKIGTTTIVTQRIADLGASRLGNLNRMRITFSGTQAFTNGVTDADLTFLAQANYQNLNGTNEILTSKATLEELPNHTYEGDRWD